MLKRYHIRDYKFNIVITVAALTIFGIVLVGSAKEALQGKQILGMVLGVCAMVAVSLVDYHVIMRFYWVLYGINLVLLIMVHLFGNNVNNATRWIEIAGIQFQPSELTKIILILFFAKFIMKYQESINKPLFLLKCIALFAIPVFLVYKQPDLSTSITLALVFAAMIFVGGLSYKYIIGILAVCIPVVAVFMVLILQPDQKILDGYQYNRIMAWIQPEKYADSTALQQTNSITAIGSGRVSGKGLNNDDVGSVKNGNFISELQTDFIFALVGEETGFIGCCIIIGLLMVIVLLCIWTAKDAQDIGGTVIAAGMASLIGFQSFFNIGVASGVLPNTGLPLPFVSYGLTSLVSLYMGIGLVINVGLQRDRY